MVKETTPKLPKPKTPNRIAHEDEQSRNRAIKLDDSAGDPADALDSRNIGEHGPQIARGKLPKKR